MDRVECSNDGGEGAGRSLFHGRAEFYDIQPFKNCIKQSNCLGVLKIVQMSGKSLPLKNSSALDWKQVTCSDLIRWGNPAQCSIAVEDVAQDDR